MTRRSDSTTLVLALAVGRIVAQEDEIRALEQEVARWEEQAVLRAATVANDLILRAREAEMSYGRLAAAVRALAQDRELADARLRGRLLGLLLEEP